MLNNFTRCNVRAPIREGDYVTFRPEDEYTGDMWMYEYKSNMQSMSGMRNYEMSVQHFPIICTGVRSGAINVEFNNLHKVWGDDAVKLIKRKHWIYRNMAQKIEYDKPPVCPIEVMYLKHKLFNPTLILNTGSVSV